MSRKNIDRQRWVKFALHLLVLILLFVLPDLLLSYTRPHLRHSTERIILVYSKAFVYVVVFYVELYLIWPHTFKRDRKRAWAFVGWNVLLVLVSTFGMVFLQYYFWAKGLGPRHGEFDTHQWSSWVKIMPFMLKDMVVVLLTIGIASAVRLAEMWTSLDQTHRELLASQRNEELISLKSQINPHFLFNTLNNIYALIAVSPAQAQDAVHKLSTMLRYVLYENPEKVDLSQEIEFVKSYISLMELRHGRGYVEARFDYDAKAHHVEIAPLLFISIIENAFKFGNTGNPEHKVTVEICAGTDGVVTCRTSNYYDERTQQKAGGGIGLVNLRRRLQLIYGDAATLKTQATEQIFDALMTIKTK